jgi:hypothetical protein
MNRKKKKLLYIRMKNSWRRYFLYPNQIITITCYHNFNPNSKYPKNEIVMDFRNRDEVVKYGIIRGKGY